MTKPVPSALCEWQNWWRKVFRARHQRAREWAGRSTSLSWVLDKLSWNWGRTVRQAKSPTLPASLYLTHCLRDMNWFSSALCLGFLVCERGTLYNFCFLNVRETVVTNMIWSKTSGRNLYNNILSSFYICIHWIWLWCVFGKKLST